MNNYWFITDENDENTRLDNYLSELFDDFSRSHFQEMIKNGKILINGKIKKSSYKVKIGDKIEVELVEKEEKIISPQNIRLDIVYEDENMLVVNKPSGMLTHPSEIEFENTLVNALLYKYGENLSDINGYFRRGIVHRLDRNTSGLLMVAKNNETHEFLAEQFKPKIPVLIEGEDKGASNSRTLIKKYLAIVKGVFKEDFGTINLPIGRHPKQPHKMAVVEGGKPSVTDFKVLERFKDCTYLELDLKTGRTHQIRVHLSYMKHPILNDTLYGGGNFKVKTQEQVLQAYKISFTKPFSNDIIELEIEPDEKIKKVLTYLRGRGQG
ncbi:MAG: RluA family pseudouridine synthase [Candidatus Gastranaerophilaceae bacterium]